jgi:urease gamma subunit
MATVTGLKNNYFNSIKVFKTKVMRSQRNGKDNAKMKYCRLVAGRRLIYDRVNLK